MGISSDADIPDLSATAGMLQRCQRLLILTGAGSSADSGVPTFRDCNGLWDQHDSHRLASRAGFAADPEAVWDWYRARREQIATCEPHEGHRTLALLQRHFHGQVLIATTNEDDLLERAGVEGVLHLHGSLFDTTCTAACGWIERDTPENARSFLPCPRCGAATRPGSVWFGEAVPADALTRLSRFDPDACLVIGSSGLVAPISEIPPELAFQGCVVVEINPTETPLSSLVTISLRQNTQAVLPHLVDLLTSQLRRAQTVRNRPTPAPMRPYDS